VGEAMSDDLKRTNPEDPTKINLKQPWEVNYWCSKFGISKKVLEDAVKAVGISVKEVEKWLRNHGHINTGN
jgi:hypothetical protein